MKRFFLSCSIVLMTASMGASSEPLVLNLNDMDTVTAGGVEQPIGGVIVRANSTGARSYSFTTTNVFSRGNPAAGLPSGTGTVIIKTHGTGFAAGTGSNSTSSTEVDSVNEQPGITIGSRPMNITSRGRYRSISIHNQVTVSGTSVDLYSMALRNIYRRR